MKTTNPIRINHLPRKLARQSGATLVELSVVIAVILLLVGVLFIGVTAWKEGANRAACVLNISSMQKAVRSYQNSNELKPGDACTMTNIAGTGLYFAAAPTCPTSGTAYTGGTVIPATGVIWAACPSTPAHTVKAGSFANW